LHLVIAKSFARIHWQNLINFGILPLTFVNPKDYDNIKQGDVIMLQDIKRALKQNNILSVNIVGKNSIQVRHDLSQRQLEILEDGGLINWVKKQSFTK
jgi:aconitate hydratase